MKNVMICFLAVIVALFICSSFMQHSGSDLEVSALKNVYTAFQTGAYENLNNAKNEAKLNGGIVVPENNMYSVYVAILYDSKNIESMINYLEKKKINYFLKEIYPSESFKNDSANYENLMINSKSDIARLKLNSKILKLYESEL